MPTPMMKVRLLAKGDRGQEVKWLKQMLNRLVVPIPLLDDKDDRFDDATGDAVTMFRLQNHVFPLSKVADSRVIITIWEKTSLGGAVLSPFFLG